MRGTRERPVCVRCVDPQALGRLWTCHACTVVALVGLALYVGAGERARASERVSHASCAVAKNRDVFGPRSGRHATLRRILSTV
eukprot:2811527-Prymnesium_polylepis.2